MKKHYNVRVIVEETTTTEPDARNRGESPRHSTVTLIELKTQTTNIESAVRKVKAALDVEVTELAAEVK